jgi:NDP-sugar pyrophosphorylase family protein
MNLEIVIMAAGMGSRFGGLKQMDGMGPSGEFLMDYAFYDAYQAGVRHFTLVVRESFKSDIETLMKEKWAKYPDITFKFICQEMDHLPKGFSSDREKPWGTTHVLYCLKDHVKHPFLVMNADDYYGKEAITQLVEFLKSNPNQHAMIGYPLQKTLSKFGPVTRGVCETEGNIIKSIEEVQKIEPDDKRDNTVSMNLWGFSPSFFELVDENFTKFLKDNIDDPKSEYQIPELVNDLLAENKVKIELIKTNSPWFGVTYKEDKPQVQQKFQKLVDDGVYPRGLFA